MMRVNDIDNYQAPQVWWHPTHYTQEWKNWLWFHQDYCFMNTNDRQFYNKLQAGTWRKH